MKVIDLDSSDASNSSSFIVELPNKKPSNSTADVTENLLSEHHSDSTVEDIYHIYHSDNAEDSLTEVKETGIKKMQQIDMIPADSDATSDSDMETLLDQTEVDDDSVSTYTHDTVVKVAIANKLQHAAAPQEKSEEINKGHNDSIIDNDGFKNDISSNDESDVKEYFDPARTELPEIKNLQPGPVLQSTPVERSSGWVPFQAVPIEKAKVTTEVSETTIVLKKKPIIENVSQKLESDEMPLITLNPGGTDTSSKSDQINSEPDQSKESQNVVVKVAVANKLQQAVAIEKLPEPVTPDIKITSIPKATDTSEKVAQTIKQPIQIQEKALDQSEIVIVKPISKNVPQPLEPGHKPANNNDTDITTEPKEIHSEPKTIKEDQKVVIKVAAVHKIATEKPVTEELRMVVGEMANISSQLDHVISGSNDGKVEIFAQCSSSSHHFRSKMVTAI